MWYEVLYRILSIINYIVLIVIAIPILVQVLYVLFSFVKKRTFPKSDKKAKIAFLIPAHNEQDVIFDTVKEVIDKQNYPRELFDIYVVAHNCTDDTAALAKKAGAKVMVLDDPDPAHRMALYPLKHGVDELINLQGDKAYDVIIHLDADNRINPEFTSLMNDAFQSGAEFARPYESATNATQNFYTKASTLFYTFDSRYGSRVRERMGIAAHVNGSGAMMSVQMLKECGGYDCETISDDAEFNLNRILEGRKGRFVEDAIVYEDMPSSYTDTLNRNKRIGSGVMKLLKDRLPEMLSQIFRGNGSVFEMFLLYMLNFLTIPLAIWVPAYYLYHFIFLGFAGWGNIYLTMQTSLYYQAALVNTIVVAAVIIVGLIVMFGFVQGFILAMLDYKKMGAKSRKELMGAVFLFPVFLMIYAWTLMVGAMSKPSWNKLKRNKATVNTDDEGAEQTKTEVEESVEDVQTSVTVQTVEVTEAPKAATGARVTKSRSKTTKTAKSTKSTKKATKKDET